MGPRAGVSCGAFRPHFWPFGAQMNILVLGAGLQGCAAAYDLLQVPSVTRVTLADLNPARLPKFLQKDWGSRLKPLTLDVKDPAAVAQAMAGQNAVLCALPYYFNEPMTRAAVEAGAHFCDLGGNTEIVLQQRQLDAKAKAKGVSVIPDCGLAPGMVNILAAEGIRRLDKADRVKIFVGGLPQKPEPPLNYQIVYSLEGALDYYTTPSLVLRGGRKLEVDALSELEDVQFPTPIGTLEAFHTAGGISTLPMTWEGKVDVMEYKTLRYPGHVAIIRPIRELGLLDNQPIAVRGEVSGIKDGKPKKTAWQLIDRYDEATGITAMMRTTGYSLAITALMQADGRVTAKGVVTPDESMPAKGYIEELAKRGVKIEEV